MRQLPRLTLLATLTCCACGTTAPTPAVDVTGSYSLTLTASPSCAQNLYTRHFETGRNVLYTLRQSGSAITGTLMFFNPPVSMSGTAEGAVVSGNVVSLSFSFEFSASNIDVRRATGVAAAIVAPSTIKGRLAGTMTEVPPFSHDMRVCEATDHEFVLKRAGT
jgi:hypothetical protein